MYGEFNIHDAIPGIGIIQIGRDDLLSRRCYDKFTLRFNFQLNMGTSRTPK